MRAPRIATALSLLSATLVLLVVWTLTSSASRVLRRIAADQALAAAERTAAQVTERLEVERADVAMAVRVLAERPTLPRLLAAGSTREIAEFLERYRRGAGLERCVVLRGDAVVAAAPESMAAPPGTGASESTLAQGSELRLQAEDLVLVRAWQVVPEAGGVRVAATRTIALREAFPATDGRSVHAWSREALEDSEFDPASPLRETALIEGRSAAAHVDEQDVFLAAAPLRSGDRIVGIVEASVPEEHADLAGREWVRDVRKIALLVLLGAVVASVLLARRLAAPLERLGRAATRIGLGDFETPVPTAAGGEVGTLAATMEEMRLRLLEAAREIRRRQVESEAILAGMQEGVFDVDEDRRIRYLNPQAARMLGVTPAAAIGQFCGDVLRAVSPEGNRPCEDSCPILDARSGGTARSVEHVASGGGGRRTVLITSAAPVEGRQIQLMREESDAEAARRLRDAVLANITHEFRTPLSAQLASIEMLRDRLDALAPDEARQLVLALERGALRLLRLVDNLLESARLEAGEHGIRRRPVALDEVVEEAIESTRPLLDLRRQSIELTLPNDLPAVMGDAQRLTQVFSNLLANANKFAPAGSTIRVGAARAPAGVTLWVEDEGPGLPEGDDTVFERFGRRAGEEPEQSGLGLGLWIARSIVERHGGRLSAEHGERGARLCVILPEGRVEDPGGG